MMCRLVTVLFLINLLTSCSGKNKVPSDVLEPAKMEKIMWDMFRADEYVTSFIWKNDLAIDRVKESKKLYNEIFRIHNITKDKFEKSLSFYRTHPDLIKKIIDSLSLQEHPYRKRESIKPILDSASAID